jgi:hypothetical protein
MLLPHNYKQKLWNMKCMSFLQLLSETFLILRRTERDVKAVRFIQINHQLDTTISPVFYLTSIYSSTCFGRGRAG